MSAQINAEYRVTAREVDIDTHGLAFLTIAGTHANGGYAAFPEFGLSVGLSPSDPFYNTNELFGMLRACGDPLLPKQDEALNEIAKDLSEVITPLIYSLRGDPSVGQMTLRRYVSL